MAKKQNNAIAFQKEDVIHEHHEEHEDEKKINKSPKNNSIV